MSKVKEGDKVILEYAEGFYVVTKVKRERKEGFKDVYLCDLDKKPICFATLAAANKAAKQEKFPIEHPVK